MGTLLMLSLGDITFVQKFGRVQLQTLELCTELLQRAFVDPTNITEQCGDFIVDQIKCTIKLMTPFLCKVVMGFVQLIMEVFAYWHNNIRQKPCRAAPIETLFYRCIL